MAPKTKPRNKFPPTKQRQAQTQKVSQKTVVIVNEAKKPKSRRKSTVPRRAAQTEPKIIQVPQFIPQYIQQPQSDISAVQTAVQKGFNQELLMKLSKIENQIGKQDGINAIQNEVDIRESMANLEKEVAPRLFYRNPTPESSISSPALSDSSRITMPRGINEKEETSSPSIMERFNPFSSFTGEKKPMVPVDKADEYESAVKAYKAAMEREGFKAKDNRTLGPSFNQWIKTDKSTPFAEFTLNKYKHERR
jgi:hypothetical protein